MPGGLAALMVAVATFPQIRPGRGQGLALVDFINSSTRQPGRSPARQEAEGKFPPPAAYLSFL